MSIEDFSRIAIVNRGECAMRLVRAVREENQDADADLVSIALYTDPDRRALFVREADEAFRLGPASFVDPADGRRKNGYLDYAALERALTAVRADAVWVGWGFVSEHAEFAELCRKLGVNFLGPSPEVMRSLGDKIGSKRLAEESGVPVAPWSGGAVETLEQARRVANELGFPLMVKATAGGGGRGIRRVRAETELDEAFTGARSEALAACGDATVFMERLLEGSRHIEVQIVGDGQGTTWALGVRDCTVQRRNQKVIEESPSPALSPEQHREICDAAARLGTRAGYRGAGTVEFLYDPLKQRFSFMEVNARLQVEHPVTECTTGADLVKLQLHVGRGLPLVGDPPPPQGHAIEVRINAEDPERGFAPAPGLIELMRWPGGPGVRIDSGFIEGDRVAPEFDNMLAKLIVHGRDRAEALGRLRRALLEMRLAVRGGASNRGFLLGLLERPEVRSGEVDVGWLDRLSAQGEHLTARHADVAVVQGAIEAYDAELEQEERHFYATAARGRLRLRREIGVDLELRCRGTRYAARVFRTGPSQYRLRLEGRRILVSVDRLSRCERRIQIGARSHQVLTLSDGPEQLVEVDGIAHRISRDDVGMVRSPAPAVVLSIDVAVGDRVEPGDRLALLEAMKTELPVIAPCAGVVGDVLVQPNVQVDAGAPLLVLEPDAGEEVEATSDRIDFEPLETASRAEAGNGSRVGRVLEGLRLLMLGFDVDTGEARRLAAELKAARDELPPNDPELLAGEDRILAAFADVCALFEGRSVGANAGREARTPEEYLLLYLRSLDPAVAGVSPAFVDRLQRALRHYDIDSLERTRELEQALLWVCKTHARVEEEVDTVLGILERRLDQVGSLREEATPELRALLDRIVAASRQRFQSVSDLAREVRYRTFDRPFFERIQEQVYANAETQLAAAARENGGRSRSQKVRALVDCPQPLAPLLMRRMAGDDGPSTPRELGLEVLMRRYYRIRTLENLRGVGHEGLDAIQAEYDHPGGLRVRALSCYASWDALGETLAGLREPLRPPASDGEDVVDLF
ncbi:MAG: ATP-grasp domain-containing protein, partial [Myxococcales bacterium]|nr:ATP-grasp domain-containing protein [Myxococcales bacterium]